MPKQSVLNRTVRLQRRLRLQEIRIWTAVQKGTASFDERQRWGRCLRKVAHPTYEAAADTTSTFIKMGVNRARSLQVYSCTVQRSDALGLHYHNGHEILSRHQEAS